MTKLLKVLVINFVCFFLISCGGSSESNDCITKYRSETTFVSSFVPQAIQYSEELLTKENNSCSPHLFIGTPYNSDQLLCREGFAAGYNYTDKIADWSSYMLTKESVTASFPRTDNYTVDHEIPPYAQSASSDYTNTALDRGHLVPVAAIDFSVKSVEESYYMSNIVPQHLSLNRGLWAGIEQWVRDCTVEVGKLFVYTGVINTSKEEMIGNSVQVPDFFYKIIIKPSSPAQSIAFLIPNVDPNGSDMSEYITSLETIERCFSRQLSPKLLSSFFVLLWI
jgi:endonuclease G